MLTEIQKQIHERALLISHNFKRTEIELIEILQEVRSKQIFLALGFSSLFEYATKALSLSESNAYTYTKIAKVSERIPELKEEIKNGGLTIANARRIAPILTAENKVELLENATSLTTKALEKVVAEINPQPVREAIRIVAPDRHCLKVGISEETLQKLKRAQTLISNQKRKPVSLEDVIETILDEYIQRTDPVTKAERVINKAEVAAKRNYSASVEISTSTSSKTSTSPKPFLVSRPNAGHTKCDIEFNSGMTVSVAKRHPIAAFIKHQIHKRDLGRCQFKSGERICGSAHFIEIHHKRAVASGGTNDLQNLTTLCGAHHKYLHASARESKSTLWV